jgi:hypothetical protein
MDSISTGSLQKKDIAARCATKLHEARRCLRLSPKVQVHVCKNDTGVSRSEEDKYDQYELLKDHSGCCSMVRRQLNTLTDTSPHHPGYIMRYIYIDRDDHKELIYDPSLV